MHCIVLVSLCLGSTLGYRESDERQAQDLTLHLHSLYNKSYAASPADRPKEQSKEKDDKTDAALNATLSSSPARVHLIKVLMTKDVEIQRLKVSIAKAQFKAADTQRLKTLNSKHGKDKSINPSFLHEVRSNEENGEAPPNAMQMWKDREAKADMGGKSETPNWKKNLKSKRETRGNATQATVDEIVDLTKFMREAVDTYKEKDCLSGNWLDWEDFDDLKRENLYNLDDMRIKKKENPACSMTDEISKLNVQTLVKALQSVGVREEYEDGSVGDEDEKYVGVRDFAAFALGLKLAGTKVDKEVLQALEKAAFEDSQADVCRSAQLSLGRLQVPDSTAKRLMNYIHEIEALNRDSSMNPYGESRCQKFDFHNTVNAWMLKGAKGALVSMGEKGREAAFKELESIMANMGISTLDESAKISPTVYRFKDEDDDGIEPRLEEYNSELASLWVLGVLGATGSVAQKQATMLGKLLRHMRKHASRYYPYDWKESKYEAAMELTYLIILNLAVLGDLGKQEIIAFLKELKEPISQLPEDLGMEDEDQYGKDRWGSIEKDAFEGIAPYGEEQKLHLPKFYQLYSSMNLWFVCAKALKLMGASGRSQDVLEAVCDMAGLHLGGCCSESFTENCRWEPGFATNGCFGNAQFLINPNDDENLDGDGIVYAELTLKNPKMRSCRPVDYDGKELTLKWLEAAKKERNSK